MTLPIIRVFFRKTLVKFSWFIQIDRKRAYVLPCASLRGMVKCQGLEAATLLMVETLTFSQMEWLPLVVCPNISACLDSGNTGMTVVFSVFPHQWSSARTHYAYIYNILIENIDKGTPILLYEHYMHYQSLYSCLPVTLSATFSQLLM